MKIAKKKGLAAPALAAGVALAQMAATPVKAQPTEGGANRETRAATAKEQGGNAPSRAYSVVRKLDNYWINLSLGLDLSDAKLLTLRDTFKAARATRLKGYDQARRSRDWETLANAMEGLQTQVESAMKQTLSPQEFARATGKRVVREGGARRSPEADAPGGTGPRDGEGPAKTGPRDGEGATKEGPKDGEGGAQEGPRDGA